MKSLPAVSLIVAFLFVVSVLGAVILVDFNAHTTPIIISIVGLVISTVPSMISSAYSERASKDIRNGVVTEKAKVGALEALDETGVIEVVNISNRGESSILAMNALSRLLEAANKGSENDKPND